MQDHETDSPQALLLQKINLNLFRREWRIFLMLVKSGYENCNADKWAENDGSRERMAGELAEFS